MPKFDREGFNEIKKLIVIALASDDNLVEELVLKGGSAIALISPQDKCLSRTSYDVDFSLDEENADLDELDRRINATLEQTFKENGYSVFDYKFQARPKRIHEDRAGFWGGYQVEFKLSNAQGETIIAHNNSSPKFIIEISRYEYTRAKQAMDFEGYKIYIYSPEMIVSEKLRALCQQLPEYGKIINKDSFTARARDFYDIMTILETHPIDPTTSENSELLKNIFDAKKVPLDFIQKLRGNLDLHRDDWNSVQNTVVPQSELRSFEYYAEGVLSIFEKITFPQDSTTSTA